MQEQFEVIEINNNTMKLKTTNSAACGSCGASGACGTGVLSKYFSTFSTFDKPLTSEAKVGGLVTLEISSSELFFRAFQLYILPIVVMFVSAYISSMVFNNEVWQILIGFTGFFLTIFTLKYFTK